MTAHYREYRPPQALAAFVERFWTVETGEEPVRYPVLPDGCLDIVDNGERGIEAVGAMLAPKTVVAPARARLVGVRFRTGMAGHFLRVRPGELTGRQPALEDLWGAAARSLHQRLLEAPSAAEKLRTLRAALPSPPENPAPWRARLSGLSPRQFRRRCLEETGLAPKTLDRVLRFRRALRTLRTAPDLGWAEIAAECGYYDQSHLIRDFREFAGATPAEWAAARGRNLQSSGKAIG
jgi:hypothetical protein